MIENSENEIIQAGNGLNKTDRERILKNDPLISKLIDELGLELT